MRNVHPVVQPVNADDTSTNKPSPVETVALKIGDDNEESKEEGDSSKPADAATDPAEGDGAIVTNDEPKPQTTGLEVADSLPTGPEQKALCDSCAVRALLWCGSTSASTF